MKCRYCENPDNIISKDTCCTGCSALKENKINDKEITNYINNLFKKSFLNEIDERINELEHLKECIEKNTLNSQLQKKRIKKSNRAKLIRRHE